MSGCGILTNGKGTRREYGTCNLDELNEGDRIGLVRQRSGELRFFVNGRDQGVAAADVPLRVWGVVDLYGRTVKGAVLSSFFCFFRSLDGGESRCVRPVLFHDTSLVF